MSEDANARAQSIHRMLREIFADRLSEEEITKLVERALSVAPEPGPTAQKLSPPKS